MLARRANGTAVSLLAAAVLRLGAVGVAELPGNKRLPDRVGGAPSTNQSQAAETDRPPRHRRRAIHCATKERGDGRVRLARARPDGPAVAACRAPRAAGRLTHGLNTARLRGGQRAAPLFGDEKRQMIVVRVPWSACPKRRSDVPPMPRDEDQYECSRLFWEAVIEALREKGAELRAQRAAEAANEPSAAESGS